MKLIQTLAFACACATLPVAAMQHMSDSELSHIKGQVSVVVLADLNVEIDSISNKLGASQNLVKLQNFLLSGWMGTTVDVLSDSAYKSELERTLKSYGVPDVHMNETILSVSPLSAHNTFGHVAQVTFPSLPVSAMGNGLNVSIASVRLGNNSTSMGGVQIKNIDPTGTKVWVIRH